MVSVSTVLKKYTNSTNAHNESKNILMRGALGFVNVARPKQDDPFKKEELGCQGS